jgi:hypothetical protein
VTSVAAAAGAADGEAAAAGLAAGLTAGDAAATADGEAAGEAAGLAAAGLAGAAAGLVGAGAAVAAAGAEVGAAEGDEQAARTPAVVALTAPSRNARREYARRTAPSSSINALLFFVLVPTCFYLYLGAPATRAQNGWRKGLIPSAIVAPVARASERTRR